jgi:hypothetical protein
VASTTRTPGSTAAPAKKTAAKKTVAKKAATSGGKKAAGIIAAGGGPEDPIADVLAGLSMRRSAASKAKIAKQPAIGGSRLAAGNKVLLAEFTACFVVLGIGTMVAPSGSKDGVPRLMSRGTGLCLLFFILALVSGAGPGARKAANGLGALVTVAYLVTSSDARNVFSWITAFYSTSGAGTAAGSGLGDLGASASGSAAGAALGQVGVAGQAGSGLGDLAGATNPLGAAE